MPRFCTLLRPLSNWLLLLLTMFVASSNYGANAANIPGSEQQWNNWRGPLATGVAPHANPPTRWSETDNVRWRTELPGAGHSSPVVWNDHVFVLSAIPIGDELAPVHTKAVGAHDNIPVNRKQRFVAIAIDRKSGKILWQKTLREALPHDGGGHYTASLASQSPITDGKHLYVSLGSQGLYCLDFAGEIVWKKDLGKMFPIHGHGEGSSPALASGVLLVNWDHERDSFLIALDTKTGKEKWRSARDEVTTWGTPIVVNDGGKEQVIVSGTKRIRSYDLANGEALWECGGLSTNVVASPVYGDGILFAGSSYDTKAMLAIRLKGTRGDVTGGDEVLWSRNRATPYVPSPLLYGKTLYFLNHYQGVMIGVDPETGKDKPGNFRLPGITDVYSSPVAAAGRLYITDREGTTVVYEHGSKPKFLAENRLDDRFSASAALVGRQLILRGEKAIYCLEEKE